MDGCVDACIQRLQALRAAHAEALRAHSEAAEAEREAMAQHFDRLLEEQRAEARAREEALHERGGRVERELGSLRRALERAEEQAQGTAELVGWLVSMRWAVG